MYKAPILKYYIRKLDSLIFKDYQHCRITLFYIASIFFFIGCKTTYNPRDTWQKALSQCASDDMLSNKNKTNLLFLGLSNEMGPGSAWRYDSSNKGFEPRWAVEKAIVDPTERGKIFNPKGASPTCSVNFSVTNSLQIKALFNSDSLKLGASNLLSLDKASSMVIKFDKWRKDIIDEVAYEMWIQKNYSQNAYAKDLLKLNRMVMKSAIWVDGFDATVKINSKILDSLGANLDLQSPIKMEGNLTFKRTANDEVLIQSKEGFYIIGTFVKIKDGVFPFDGTGTTPDFLSENSVHIADKPRVKQSVNSDINDQ